MTRTINDSVQAVLLVYEKLKTLDHLDGLQSSVSLLPQHLIEPYQEPLGNEYKNQFLQ